MKILTLVLSIALGCVAVTANGQSTSGTIVGIIKDSSNAPLPGATITAVRQDGASIRSTISNSDGIYSFADVVPGTYSIQAKTANHMDLSVSSVEVVAGDATRADIAPPSPALVSSLSVPPSVMRYPSSTSGTSDSSSSVPPGLISTQRPKPSGNFWTRLAKGETITWKDLNAQYPRTGSHPAEAETAPLTRSAIAPVDPASAETAPQAAAVLPPQEAPPAVDTQTPFGDADWTWLNGNSRQKDFPLDSKYFSGEFRADTFFGIDFNQPKDHSMGGSSEVFRSGEFQLEDLSVGGDFHAGNMRGRVLALFGLFSSTTVRNDASPAVGQWDVRSAYKYISEAYGGYHFNVQHGLNVDAGIFVSYVGLFSYHNFDNWAYQPSYVSSNTPWFFNGVRIQWFPTQHLKIEPWIINGWQSYNKFNGHLGLGGQIRWAPKPWLMVIGNQYGYGEDNVGLPHRTRYHTDDSIEVKYYDKPKAGNGLDKMAFTFTGDLGCETGQGVTCTGGKGGPKQSFLGYMAYNRWWWHKDEYAFTLGGGQINNPGRYLTLVLPVNGADAISGTPYFPSYPGASFKAYDATATFDWMPSQFMTFRTEFGYRHSNVPYWSGRQGITPPGGNNGFPAQYVCNDGTPSIDGTTCGSVGLWRPDLRKGQALLSFSIMVKL